MILEQEYEDEHPLINNYENFTYLQLWNLVVNFDDYIYDRYMQGLLFDHNESKSFQICKTTRKFYENFKFN